MTIGVSDANCHRIPNKLLGFLLVLICLSALTQTSSEVSLPILADKITAFGITFVFGLVLYLLRVLAPGDVKLIAVLGFYLGAGELTSYFYYVCLAIIFIGPMYWLMNQLHLAFRSGSSQRFNGQVCGINLTSMAVSLELSKQELKRKISTGNDLSYMPFAPILIIGLALHNYYT